MIRSKKWQIPILMYHHLYHPHQKKKEIVKNTPSLSVSVFEEQMKILALSGYQTLSLTDLLSKTSLSPKSLILTFDDGYSDAYTIAFPLLKKYGFSAIFYVIVQGLGKENYLTVAQLQEMEQAGMSIGSHTLKHHDLSQLNVDSLTDEIFKSKEHLQTLGLCVKDFAYPFGKYHPGVSVLVEKAGYQSAVTTRYGVATSLENAYELPRFAVENHHRGFHLLRLLNCNFQAIPTDKPKNLKNEITK